MIIEVTYVTFTQNETRVKKELHCNFLRLYGSTLELGKSWLVEFCKRKNIRTKYGYGTPMISLKCHAVSFYKKSGVSFTVHAPAPLYSKYPLPIKAAKATDLQRLSMYVPHTLRCMYIGLPTVEDECESE